MRHVVHHFAEDAELKQHGETFQVFINLYFKIMCPRRPYYLALLLLFIKIFVVYNLDWYKSQNGMKMRYL